MHTLYVDDVNEALPRALAYLRDCGEPAHSRNGPVRVAPGPVATVYRDPRRRVLFDPVRDANPFFHLFEALWILAGRKDVRTLAWFNKRMVDYSDNGVSFHAPYGYRLRYNFGTDQIAAACAMLRKDPDCRRAVMSIWDTDQDLKAESKDIPCNDMVMTRVRTSRHTTHRSGRVLDITVCNRSNDAIWGAYGANAVQFSFLQEYMAHQIGVGVGEYTQMSNNLHVYTENPYWQSWAQQNQGGVYVPESEYTTTILRNLVSTSPLFGYDEDESANLEFHHFDADLAWFNKELDEWDSLKDFVGALETHKFRTHFFERIVKPMLALYVHRDVNADTAFRADMYDWHYAGAGWVLRRKQGAKA